MVKRICAWCGKEFEVRQCIINRGEGKFCSRTCAITHLHQGQRKPVKKKPCEYCGTLTSNKQFCSVQCSNKSRRKDGWGICAYCGNEIPPTRSHCNVVCRQLNRYRKMREKKLSPTKDFLIYERTNTCEECGLSEWQDQPIPLELHHRDGNRANNKLNNLVLLCPNCHALTPNYRGRGQNNYGSNKKKVPDESLKQALLDNISIAAALRSVGLAGGGNYERCYNLLGRTGSAGVSEAQ